MGFVQEGGKGRATWSAPEMTAEQEAATFGGSGLNGDVAALGNGIQTTDDFADVSAAGGGMGTVIPTDLPVTPDVIGEDVVPSSIVPTTTGMIYADMNRGGIANGALGGSMYGDTTAAGTGGATTGDHYAGDTGRGIMSTGMHGTTDTRNNIITPSSPRGDSDIDPWDMGIGDPAIYQQPATDPWDTHIFIPKVETTTVDEPIVDPQRTGQTGDLFQYGFLGSKLPPSLRGQTQGIYGT